MQYTLYTKLVAFDKFNINLREKIVEVEASLNLVRELSGYDEFHIKEIPQEVVSACQRRLIQEYECNPVLLDAIKKRVSVEDSLKELAKVNRPVRRLFPMKRDTTHNKRLEEIGELISSPSHLKTKGSLSLDNLVSGTFIGFGFVLGATYLVGKYLIPTMYIDPIPIRVQEEINLNARIMSIVSAAFLAPVLGAMTQTINRVGYLPIDEAKYLDKKVLELC